MQRNRRLVSVVAMALALAAAAASATPASALTRTKVRRLAPGLTVMKIYRSGGPWRIRVLKVNPRRAVSLDVTLAAPTFGTFAKTSVMGRVNGALAAVNGDFSRWLPVRPLHPFADDGNLIGTQVIQGANFAERQDGTGAFAGPRSPTITATIPSSGTTLPVAQWNHGAPVGDEIAGFTPVGGSVSPPPPDACSVRLLPVAGPAWSADQSSVVGDYTVDAVACQSSAMALEGGIVLAAPVGSTAGLSLAALAPGTALTLGWTMGWRDVATTIGGSTLLVARGVVIAQASCGSYFCDRNPRTAVGYTAKGDILLLTVDGRQRRWSVGMTLVELGREMVRLGAVRAVNLDGGGSTTMWVRGLGVVNRPSDPTGQRAVSSALLVLPAAEPGPGAAPGSAARRGGGGPMPGLSPAQVAATERAMLADPGSTGGLLDALEHGAFGFRGTLPADLRRVAAAYRTAVGDQRLATVGWAPPRAASFLRRMAFSP